MGGEEEESSAAVLISSSLATEIEPGAEVSAIIGGGDPAVGARGPDE